ncbi:hypothetical protein [Achromobacter sp. UMC71]|uniref:hypothetical protein n=1 Tax=Achromobacter sp. UMC71 TaxID=1862320 RepID=UPI001603B181|nr:hypothetical protein [Achromobacter sp. UMC71]
MNEKEIIDYLRNVQKSAEIEAKINGINIWALLGAAALIAWQLLGSIALWDDIYAELALRATLCAQALYFLISLTIPSNYRKDEPRYISTFREDAYTPLIVGVVVLLPVFLYWHFIGSSLILILPGLFGCVAMWISISTICHWLRGPHEHQLDRLPKSHLSLSPVRDHVVTIIFIISFGVMIASELKNMIPTLAVLPAEVSKSLCLVAVLYMVILAIIAKRQKNHSISWTYGLETDLLLKLTAPEDALKQIEYRRLGIRLQEVMNNFFNDLDETFEKFDYAVRLCAEQLNTASQVPSYDAEERAARSQRIASTAASLIAEAETELGKLIDYLDRLDIKHKLDKRSIALVLRNIRKRQEEYSSKAVQKKRELQLLVEQYAPEPRSNKNI